MLRSKLGRKEYGTINTLHQFLQKWLGTELCNSVIYDDDTNVGIGAVTRTEKLVIAGNNNFSGGKCLSTMQAF